MTAASLKRGNMFLTFIFGVFLLPWPHAWIAPSVHAMASLWSKQEQEQSSNSSPQSSQSQPTDQPEAHDQSAKPPQPPATTAPCPDKAQPGSTAPTDCKGAESAGAKTRKHRRSHKTVAPADAPPQAGPTQKVVRNGSTTDPIVELSPGLSPQQVSDQREITKQLVAKSDADLKKISGRQLSTSQQDTVNQIKSYLEQANKALSDGDVQRAHNLAVKANLLSAEVMAH